MSKNRKGFNTTLDVDLMKQIKFLALSKDKNANDLLEEGMRYVLKKHEYIDEGGDFTLGELKRLQEAVKMKLVAVDNEQVREDWNKIYQKLSILIDLKEVGE